MMPTSANLATVAAVIAVVVLVVWMRSRKGVINLQHIDIPDVGRIVWSKGTLDGVDPVILGTRLRVIKLALWPKYEAIYGETVRCWHSPIRIDPEFYKPAEVKDIDRERLFYLNPLMDYERAYGAELHNLYRCEKYGFKHCYRPFNIRDRRRYNKATALWQAL